MPDCQWQSRNNPGLDLSIPRHSWIWGAAGEAVLNIVRKKIKKKIYLIVALLKNGIKGEEAWFGFLSIHIKINLNIKIFWTVYLSSKVQRTCSTAKLRESSLKIAFN